MEIFLIISRPTYFPTGSQNEGGGAVARDSSSSVDKWHLSLSFSFEHYSIYKYIREDTQICVLVEKSDATAACYCCCWCVSVCVCECVQQMKTGDGTALFGSRNVFPQSLSPIPRATGSSTFQSSSRKNIQIYMKCDGFFERQRKRRMSRRRRRRRVKSGREKKRNIRERQPHLFIGLAARKESMYARSNLIPRAH